MKKKICMVVQDEMVKGGIAAVINGYRGSELENQFEIIYVESFKDGSKLDKFLKAIKSYCLFLKILFLEKPDLIHIHSSFGASFYRKLPFIYLSYWFNIPIINHVHGSEFNKFYTDSNLIKKMLVRNSWSKCSAIIALSEEWKKVFSLVMEEEKIIVIENYSTIRTKIENEKSVFQVLFLGAINEKKGCFDIPLIVKRIKNIIPQCKFIMAGDGEIEKVKALAEKYGVENNIVFPGWVRTDEKESLLLRSNVFILPSYTEGMPMSILDAMGYGLPIISTNVGSIPNIVINDRNGYLFNPGDIDGFSDAIIRLLKNNDMARDFGSESYKIIMENYTLECHLSKLIKLYNYLLYK